MSTYPTLEIDNAANAAYLKLNDNDVDATRSLTEQVLVDIDKFGVVVGVELLTVSAEVPVSELVSRFHVLEADQPAVKAAFSGLRTFRLQTHLQGTTSRGPDEVTDRSSGRLTSC